VHLTYRYRVKSSSGALDAQARAVTYVWNYCNDVQKQALKWGKKWPTAFDLHKLTAGSYKELGLSSGTIEATCDRYVRSRRQHRKPFLRWRNKRSLGWVPLRADYVRRAGKDAFRVNGRTWRVFMSRALPDGKICDGGSFSRDAKGNWFLNISIEIPQPDTRQAGVPIGIDLGLSEFATLSTGETIANPRHYAALQTKLGVAQRARHKRRTSAIHIKIANSRRDFHHKLSSRITREFAYVAVGNVGAARLSQTHLAKSVKDAGWSAFRNMLAYKSIANGAIYEEVEERFTSQVCSSCGALPDSRPKGIADHGMRRWTCSECGASHDRDVNAALNILARSGYRAPAEGAGL